MCVLSYELLHETGVSSLFEYTRPSRRVIGVVRLLARALVKSSYSRVRPAQKPATRIEEQHCPSLSHHDDATSC